MIPVICSTLAGILFGAGQLLWLDAFATADVEFILHVPGILSVLGLVMLNIVSWESVIGDYTNPFASEGGTGVARCWVFLALCFSFGGVINSLWMLAMQAGDTTALQQIAGQNGLMFVSSLLFRASRTASSDDQS